MIALKQGGTGIAYEIRLVLCAIYKSKDAQEARMLFRNWCGYGHAMRELTGELVGPVAPAASMIKGHLE